MVELPRDDNGYIIDNNYEDRGYNGMAYDDAVDSMPPRFPESKKYMKAYTTFNALYFDEYIYEE
jgi:hypothetical protein